MGTNYDVYCCDCESTSGLGDGGDVRWAQAALIFQLATLTVPLASLPWGDSVRVGRVHLPLDWFAAHAGHKLALRSEYGEIETPDLTVGRCRTCEHWENLDAEGRGVGNCALVQNEDGWNPPKGKRTLAFATGEAPSGTWANLRAMPEFGCVQWKARK